MVAGGVAPGPSVRYNTESRGPGTGCVMPYRKLEGLRVLVTGASQGIGRALCVAAARRGCKVIAAARSQPLLDELATEVRTAGGIIETVAADVTSPADRQAMADAALRHFGGLDVLVNNAGIG